MILILYLSTESNMVKKILIDLPRNNNNMRLMFQTQKLEVKDNSNL
jgi:hypothetical protein